jgi:hypothetical protein
MGKLFVDFEIKKDPIPTKNLAWHSIMSTLQKHVRSNLESNIGFSTWVSKLYSRICGMVIFHLLSITCVENAQVSQRLHSSFV